jgi:hypothetical protein
MEDLFAESAVADAAGAAAAEVFDTRPREPFFLTILTLRKQQKG